MTTLYNDYVALGFKKVVSEITGIKNAGNLNVLTSEQREATENQKYIKNASFLLVIFKCSPDEVRM